MPSDVFRVFAYDICTNTLICELPANGLTFGRRLNDAGPIGFTIDLLDPRSAAQAGPFLNYYRAQVPVALYVDRDGVLVWGGYQTTGAYTHTAHVLPVQGKEWPAFFAQRTIAQPYDAAHYAAGIDPAALLATAVGDAQDTTQCGPGAWVGVYVSRSPASSSGVPWIVPSYTMQQSTVAQVIADCVAGVTPGTGGVDYYTDTAWSGGAPRVTMRVASPRAGRAAGTTQFSIDLLGAEDFTWPQDYQQACTTLYETGGGSGQVKPSITVRAPGVAVGGLGQSPRLDKVIQHSNVLSPEWLTQLAQGEAQEFAGAVVTPTVTLRTADPSNPLGSWIPGDDCRLVAEPFELYPAGIDAYWRVIAYDVTVPDDGVPTVTLTFNPPPIF